MFKSLLSVLFVCTAWGLGGPLTFLATQQLASYEVTLGRIFFAFLPLIPFLFIHGKKIWKLLPLKGRILLFSSGAMLGLHFFLFVSGVANASLATAVLLVATEPVLILVIGLLWFREPFHAGYRVSFILCLIGVFFMTILPIWAAPKTMATGSRSYGDLCAIFATIVYGVYYGLNRGLRPYLPSLEKQSTPIQLNLGLSSVIYFAAFFVLLVPISLGVWQGVLTLSSPSSSSWLMLVGLGFIPTLLGHTVNQMMSRKAHPIWVAFMSPGETAIALLIAFFFLGQSIQWYEALGGICIFLAVLVCTVYEVRDAMK